MTGVGFTTIIGIVLAVLPSLGSHAARALYPGTAAPRFLARPQEQTIPFTEVMQRYAARYQRPIVAEGVPIRPEIARKDFEALWERNDPIEKGLPAAAALFDYQAMRHGRGYLLLKRYTDPFDIPEVSLEELHAATQEVIAILNWASPPVEKGTLADNRVPDEGFYFARQIIASFTPEQIRTIQGDKNSVIRVANLAPNQKLLLQKLALYKDFGNARKKAEALLRALENLRMSTVVRDTTKRGDPIGFRTKYTASDGSAADAFSPIPPPALASRDNDPTATYLRASEVLKNGKAASEGTITYAEFAKNRNRRASTKEKIEFRVEEGIDQKRVTLIGTSDIESVALFRMAAAVHGLRVRQQQPGIYEMIRPSLKLPQNAKDVYPAIRAAVPDALARAFHYGVIPKREAPTSEGTAPLITATENALDLATLEARPMRLELTSLTMFRILADTELVPQKESPPVPVSEIRPLGRFLLATYMAFGNGFLASFARKTPDMPGSEDRFAASGIRFDTFDRDMSFSIWHIDEQGTPDRATYVLTFPKR